MRSTCRAGGFAGALVFVLLSIGVANRAPAETLEAIPLQHRLADELLPILQPLLPPGTALTGAGDVLLVRADTATVQQLRAAVAALDRPPRQLLITVGQATDRSVDQASVRGSATIGTDDVQVGVNQPPSPHTGAQVAVQARRDQLQIQDVSSVRTLEGREAYVALTTSQPFTTTISRRAHGVDVQTVTDYEAERGFFATPRLNGDRVMLEISPRQQRLITSPRDARVATQTLTTSVSGRLGEWIELGGIAERDARGTTWLMVWGARSELTQYSAWVKVEELR